MINPLQNRNKVITPKQYKFLGLKNSDEKNWNLIKNYLQYRVIQTQYKQ